MLKPLAEQILETYSADPKYGRVFNFEAPVDLAHYSAFTGGQPFGAFREMREKAPVCWFREPTELGGGFWALTRHDDVRHVSLNPQLFSSQKGGILMAYGPPENRHPGEERGSVEGMIKMDAPWKLQLRKEHMP